MKNQDKQDIEQLQLFEELPEVVQQEQTAQVGQNETVEEHDFSGPLTDAVLVDGEEQSSAPIDASPTQIPSSTISIQPLESFQQKHEQQKKESANNKDKSKKETNWLIEGLDIIRSVAICFFLTWLFVTFIAKPIRIDGTSMFPSLHHNDYGFSSVIGVRIGELKRFDVVVVYEPILDDYVIKRIIALPGEAIFYQDNQLYINGEYVEESFFDYEYTTSMMTQTNDYFTNNFDELVLGDNEYFIMGDNRPKSSDSREYGAIQKDQIISKGTLILFPFQNVGFH